MTRLLSVELRLAVVLLLLSAVPASARDTAFPGLNGRIVFASKRDAGLRSDLLAASMSGGPVRSLTRSPTWDELGPVPSPDGQMVAYRRWRMRWHWDFEEALGRATSSGSSSSIPGPRESWERRARSPHGRRTAG
jgi:Tol biopolymer transport system component